MGKPNATKPILALDSEHFLQIFMKRAQEELGNKALSDFSMPEARKKIKKLLAPDLDKSRVPLPTLNVAVGDSSLKFEHNDATIKLPYKIYAPKDHDDQLPVMMYFHGGGFALGDAALIDFGCQYFAEHLPCRVISVEYRKSPEYKFPTAHHDAYFSSLYVAEHPDEFKSNGTIIVAGDSAGGNLATSVCHMAKADNKFQITAQVLIYPWTDLNNHSRSDIALAHGYYLEKSSLDWMTGLYITTADDKNNPLASPLLRTEYTNLPPAYVTIGDADPIHDDAKAYADKMQAAGVNVECKVRKGLLHDYCALPNFYHAAEETFNDIVAFLKKVGLKKI